ncbi:MAG: hypothetical protein GC147_03785 [Porphyrobacter sp.]|nr:hypothetical protein [Porphyrobacter sp.]
MTRHVASAVFATRPQAETAIAALRRKGIEESAISVISKHDESFEREHGHDHHSHHDHADTKASGAGKGLAIGAGGGAIAGLAALAIPGVAPFFAAGAVAQALGIVGSTAATSAVVGGAIGGITGALMHYGVDEDDARYFEKHLQSGAYWVGVDLDDSRANRAEVEAILDTHDGSTAARPRRTRAEDVDGVPASVVEDTGSGHAGTEPARRGGAVEDVPGQRTPTGGTAPIDTHRH